MAENSLGTTYGYDYTFTTASAPDSAPTASFSASPSTTFPGGSVAFDASGSTGGSGPPITDYQWNFGDGTPVDDVGAGATVQHTYTSRGVHTVTLTVTNGEGSDSTTQTVTVDDPPTAAFTPSTSVAAPGATVSFDASASGPGDPGGTITDYTWNFGDDTPVDDTGGSADASHAFASPGIYTVALTTTDDLGVSTTSTQQVTIDAPAAAFTISPATVVAPGTAVSFDATGSTDPKGTITDYSWSFGDGTPVDDAGTSTSVQRAYAGRGTYTVTLTVTNNFGQTNTSTHTITVDDPPTAAFTSSPATVAAPGATVNFDASASAPGASGGTINDYSWNFGDGTPVDDTERHCRGQPCVCRAGDLHGRADRRPTTSASPTPRPSRSPSTFRPPHSPPRRPCPPPAPPSASTRAARPTPRARSPTTAGTSAMATPWTPAAPRACSSGSGTGAPARSRSR